MPMALSSSIQAYPDCHEFFEAVVDDPQGGRIWKGTFQAAHEFRHRCHQFRRLHRKNNEKIYKPGELMFGCSELLSEVEPEDPALREIEVVNRLLLEDHSEDREQ